MKYTGTMNIYAKKGQKVIVTKRTSHNGYSSDEERVAELLQIGKIYQVDRTEVHSSNTDVYLRGFDDVRFNSVNFVDYNEMPKESDFEEPMLDNPHGDETSMVLNKEAYDFAVRKWNRENAEQMEARMMYTEGNTKLSQTEIMVGSINAYGPGSIGCIRHKKSVMISYQKEGEETIYDLFLDHNQLYHLQNMLNKVREQVGDIAQ